MNVIAWNSHASIFTTLFRKEKLNEHLSWVTELNGTEGSLGVMPGLLTQMFSVYF